MRTKEQILDDTVKVERGPIPWDSTASIHERLTIEVLIDIRDALITQAKLDGKKEQLL